MTEQEWIATASGPGDSYAEVCHDLKIDTSGTVSGTQLRDTEEDNPYDNEADRRGL